jgi:NADH dehydrogenase
VANQQGAYLGKKLSKMARRDPEGCKNAKLDDDTLYDPFRYKHLGSLAYLGNSAVFDFGDKWSFAGGLVAMCVSRCLLPPLSSFIGTFGDQHIGGLTTCFTS